MYLTKRHTDNNIASSTFLHNSKTLLLPTLAFQKIPYLIIWNLTIKTSSHPAFWKDKTNQTQKTRTEKAHECN